MKAGALAHIYDFFNYPEIMEEITTNRFILILLVIFLLRLKQKTYKSLLLTAIVNIPGTFLHETAHFLVGFLLNARPTSFNLVPRRDGDSYITGSVGFRNVRFYNALPSALAPLALLPLGYWLDQRIFFDNDLNFGNYILYVLLQTIIIENALPSSTDFKVAFGNIYGVLFYTALIFLGIVFYTSS